mmetsp:Transcript_25489/g.41846  ORF Transcript_25489/g.41846 Transcript_25489/m.41846 type:complete len:82 (-) Transcript_25489:106-351(-)
MATEIRPSVIDAIWSVENNGVGDDNIAMSGRKLVEEAEMSSSKLFSGIVCNGGSSGIISFATTQINCQTSWYVNHRYGIVW